MQPDLQIITFGDFIQPKPHRRFSKLITGRPFFMRLWYKKISFAPFPRVLIFLYLTSYPDKTSIIFWQIYTLRLCYFYWQSTDYCSNKRSCLLCAYGANIFCVNFEDSIFPGVFQKHTPLLLISFEILRPGVKSVKIAMPLFDQCQIDVMTIDFQNCEQTPIIAVAIAWINLQNCFCFPQHWV